MISAFLLAETALGTLVIPDLTGNPEALARLGLAEQTRISWIPVSRLREALASVGEGRSRE